MRYSQEEELNLVSQAVHDYFDGATHGDIAALKRAFHADCKIYSITETGDLTFIDQTQFHQVVETNHKTYERKNRILSMDVTGNTAAVKARADYPPFAFIDYLSLLKIKDQWKIVSKTMYTIAKN